MVQKHRKTIDFLVYALLPACLLHYLYLLIFTCIIETSTLFIILGMLLILLLLPCLYYKTHADENLTLGASRQFWMLLFLVYVFQLLYLLFFSSEFSRDRVSLLDSNYLEALSTQWEYGTNLHPLYTIKSMLAIYHMPGVPNSIANINLVGNIIAFIPFSFFLPKLFPAMRKAHLFLPLLALIIILVEITQFFTLTGAMDIDDFILNYAGVVLAYFPLRSFYSKHSIP